jgi:hypothetical protein
LDGGGELAATVRDGQGRPVSGASIELRDIEGRALLPAIDRLGFRVGEPRSDSQGRIELRHVAPGKYRALVTHGGSEALSASTIEIENGHRTETELIVDA